MLQIVEATRQREEKDRKNTRTQTRLHSNAKPFSLITKMNKISFLTDSTRLTLNNLQTLRQEHHLLLSSTIDNDDKRQSIEHSTETIDLAIDEASILFQLENYFEHVDSETKKLLLQVQRLTQENNWLREELSLTEQHLQTSSQLKDDYEREIQQLNDDLAAIPTVDTDPLNFLDHIDIDQESPSIETNDRSSTTTPPPAPAPPAPASSSSTPSVTINQSDIPPRFRTLHNLVIQYAQAGRYEVAVPLCRQALEDLEKTHGHFHPDVATMLNILALVYRDQNKFQEALQLLTEALTIREKTLGFDHPAVAATLNNLAVLYGKKNRYKDAEPLCKRALEIREKYFGSDHPDVGKQLNNLALLCLNQGKYDKVEEYYKRAIEIYTKHNGVRDSNVIKTKNNLASAYIREGKFRLAFQLYQQVLNESQPMSNEQCQQTSTQESSVTLIALKNLSALCRRLALYEQADNLESCTNKYLENRSDAIQRALAVLRTIRMIDEGQTDTIKRSQPATGSNDYGRLRRSGSFQKLRQSIRRGSEKLVQKLRGTPTNPLPSMHSMQFSSLNEPIKRASSMSVLHPTSPNAFPLQQQQTNRTVTLNSSYHQYHENKFTNNNKRLSSTENFH